MAFGQLFGEGNVVKRFGACNVTELPIQTVPAEEVIDMSLHSMLYTRTWPEPAPFPLFKRAPIATELPSAEIDTENPDTLNAASPSTSAPRCVQMPFINS